MTITHGIFAVLAPVALITMLLAYLHKYGPGRAVRALAISLWALSYAFPAALVELKRVFGQHWARSMEAQ